MIRVCPSFWYIPEPDRALASYRRPIVQLGCSSHITAVLCSPSPTLVLPLLLCAAALCIPSRQCERRATHATMARTSGATSSTGGQNTDGNAAASSSAGHKRAREPEIHGSCSCAVCWEVLLDPVTLLCGHTLDQRCLQRLVAAGGSACPTCREPLPAVLPNVSVQLRDLVQHQYPQQVPPPYICLGNPRWAGAWWARWSALVVWWCFVSGRPPPST